MTLYPWTIYAGEGPNCTYVPALHGGDRGVGRGRRDGLGALGPDRGGGGGHLGSRRRWGTRGLKSSSTFDESTSNGVVIGRPTSQIRIMNHFFDFFSRRSRVSNNALGKFFEVRI